MLMIFKCTLGAPFEGGPYTTLFHSTSAGYVAMLQPNWMQEAYLLGGAVCTQRLIKRLMTVLCINASCS